MKPEKPTKERVQVTIHPVLRSKGTVVADSRGWSFSEYLERLIEADLTDPRPSVFDSHKSVGLTRGTK